MSEPTSSTGSTSNPTTGDPEPGQALIDEAHALLAESCDEASLTVLTANPRARRFYERNGWQLTDTLVEPHFARRADRGVPLPQGLQQLTVVVVGEELAGLLR